MKDDQREYLLRMASLFAAHAEQGIDIAVTPELAATWATALVAMVDDNTPKIILPGTG
jgi:hypothetical protein